MIHSRWFHLFTFVLIFSHSILAQASLPPPAVTDADPAEVAIGERLFRETRFAQYFFAHAQGDANAKLEAGDPTIERVVAPGGSMSNPYAGQGINCASCHFVDELALNAEGGSRAYGDFARRSAVPARADGKTQTLRNSPAFVNSMLALDPAYEGRSLFLHFDGEFATPEDLVIGGFTGRNFGWLSAEKSQAISHLASVIRGDDGSGELAQEFGGAYRSVLLGVDASIPEAFRLPLEYRIDVTTATDAQVMDAAARLVTAYMKSIVYSRDEKTGEFNGSSYDAFLLKNALPRKPSPGESDLEYSRRLLGRLNQLETVRFVEPSEGRLELHAGQSWSFGKLELQGLKVFLTEPQRSQGGLTAFSARPAGVGNCLACHAAPAFTDFLFHNTGVSQEEYDSVHGQGAFAAMPIPSFAERALQPEIYFGAQARFSSIPTLAHPGEADLGVWSVFGNPSLPRPQGTVREMLCRVHDAAAGGLSTPVCDDQAALEAAVALFKTPGLRDLGHSAPYQHSGRDDTLEDVMRHYVRLGELARRGRVRHADMELSRIFLNGEDVASLSAFLRSLNEDYQ